MMRFDEASGGHETVPEDWTSPTKLRALFLDDPCLLWLDYHADKFDFQKDPEKHSFLSFIGDLGNQFEDEWVRRMAPEAVRAMARDWDVRKVEGLQRTVRLMEARCPVITKAALWWGPSKIYGTADLIVRTSWLYKRFPHLCPPLSEPDHYVAIDAKFTRNLTSASKSTDLRMYEAQLRLYSFMLAGIQGHMPRRAYLVTRAALPSLCRSMSA